MAASHTLLSLVLGVVLLQTASAASYANFNRYMQARENFMRDEQSRGIGAGLTLNAKEQRLNEYVMSLKAKDIENALLDPTSFAPAMHFYEVLHKINQTELFHIIRDMPKAGVLHVHDSALANLDFFVEMTHWPHLWMFVDPALNLPQFRFSRTQPAPAWVLVADERQRIGAARFDTDLRWTLSMYNTNPLLQDRDINSIWNRFGLNFMMTDGLMVYKDAWRAYYLKVLEEFEEDNVNYMEIRSVLPELYDLDGNTYTEIDCARVFYEATQEYKRTHPKFMGAKIIYAPVRGIDDARFDHYMRVAQRLEKEFPGFVIGFDLVAMEDAGRPLIDFAERILRAIPNWKLFFHAGETNWNGVTDENLIDAILLGTSRIGHGYALTKHPRALEEVKRQGIAIEIQPISNQVLRLVADMRNHPGTTLFSDNYPVVISSDDPSFWEAKPLSHDFYYAFLGLASARQDLRVLKQLAMNSITYSAASQQEKNANMAAWRKAWDQFIDRQLQRLRL